MPFLHTLLILLTAAIIAVPFAKRLGFGSILGYLGAGLIIGPAALGLVRDVGSIAQVSELGVVMLLFLIGLELRPTRLWVMRRAVLGLGSAQVALTSAALALLAHLAGLEWRAAAITGFALSLSSTAIILPLLAEQNLLSSHAGRDSFGVLLFQDIAVIPAVALIPLLHDGGAPMATGAIWLAIAKALAALFVVLLGGRFLIRGIFRLVDRANAPEIFTATALVVVGGTAALVSAVGLSMSLGAFMAGVLLSDSDYRHELKADIEPFEGLLLGMFFVSVGMSANLALFVVSIPLVLSAVFALIAVKAAICFLLAKLFGRESADALRFAFALPLAGEFGFVILSAAVGELVMTPEQAALVTLIITISMIVAPLLFQAIERWLVPLISAQDEAPFDDLTGVENPIILCGFGRVGQIVGRILRLHDISFTALDKSAEQIDLVRRFGSQAYYGDASRVDLLRAAGAAEAKIIVIAVDDIEASLQIADHARRHFPNLTVLARARNRRHAHLLMDRDVTHIVRETFHSSLRLIEKVLAEFGMEAEAAKSAIALFEARDEENLIAQHGFYADEKQMIQTSKQVTEELRGLFEADRAQRIASNSAPAA